MSAAFKNAQNGDTEAFAEIYSEIYTKLYCLAYHSLANEQEAVNAVKTATRDAYSDIRSCRSEGELNGLMLKKLCEQIILRYREYRKTPPKYETDPPYIKAQMRKLTDAERFSVAMWALFGFGAKEISKFSGLSETVVENKLKSARLKLEPVL
ncbi:MAG: hypothetical protein NC394_05455 [Bacteroides sp.]|nr:hypothetical protein [Bacteroides sp.]